MRFNPRFPDGPDLPDDPPSEPPDPVELSLDVASPAAGTALTGSSAGVTVQVSGTASVASGGGFVRSVEVQFGGGDFVAASETSPRYGEWSCSQLITTPGPLRIIARAQHSRGQRAQTQVDVDITITEDAPTGDTVPPAIAITSPRANRALVADAAGQATVTITGTASDAGTGIAELGVLVDGIPATVTQIDGSWSQWRADVALVGLGVHAVTAFVKDGVGLSTEASLPLEVVAVPPTRPLAERLMLVEKLRLSSYLGAYGVGRTIRTISLLPGQQDQISVTTYRSEESTATEASSMLDSFTTESQQDFESTLTREQSNKSTADESLKWNVEAKGSVGWGFGNASLSAGASGGTNAAREEVAKSVNNAVQKHAAKASSKRDIDIKTSKETKTKEGEETSTKTTVANINVGRTQNFVFSQMNQEFITLLHLVDVRVAYVRIDKSEGTLYTLSLDPTVAATAKFAFRLGETSAPPIAMAEVSATAIKTALDGLGAGVTGAVSVLEIAPGTFELQLEREGVGLELTGDARAELRAEGVRATYQEVTLSQLDGLLRRVIRPDKIAQVRDGIITILTNVFDYQDEPHTMVEEKLLNGRDGTPLPNGSYLRVPKGKTSTYVDPATGTHLEVPGVILAAMHNVMRTDGVFCDTILGQGQALDDYSQGLQDAAVHAKELENDRQAVEIERQKAGLELVRTGNSAGAAVYRKVFPPDENDRLALATLPVGGDANGHTA